MTASGVTTVFRTADGRPTCAPGIARGYEVKVDNASLRPPLPRCHVAACLSFARLPLTWADNWRSVVFSAAKKFNLGGPGGFKYCWHDFRSDKAVAIQRF